MIGKMISHFQVIARLGQGGMSKTSWLMTFLWAEESLLKFLSQDLQQDPDAQKRLRREARVAAAPIIGLRTPLQFDALNECLQMRK